MNWESTLNRPLACPRNGVHLTSISIQKKEGLDLMPRVSVIVPSYNAERFIAFTLTSILEQTYRDFEIIIVDDGSTDNTAQIVSSFSKEDTRIKYYRQENSGTPSSPRNNGIARASGDFIAFCDADDLWSKEHLELSITMLENQKGIDLSFTNFQQFGSNVGHESAWFLLPHVSDAMDLVTHVSIGNSWHLFKKPIYLPLLSNNFIHTSSVVLRKSVISSQSMVFDESITAGEDRDLWLNLARNGSCFAFNTKTLVHYRINEGTASRNNQTHLSHILLWERLLKNEEDLHARSLIKKRLILNYRAFVINATTLDFVKPSLRVLEFIPDMNAIKTCCFILKKIIAIPTKQFIGGLFFWRCRHKE